MELLEAQFACAACGETNDVFVDPSGGANQSYVEDCHVCCRPNLLTIRYDPETGTCDVDANLEG